MKNLLVILVLFLLGCKSNKFALESTSIFTFKEIFFTETPAAIQEGNSFATVTLEFQNFDGLKNIELIGIYFKEKYALLKAKNKVTYQASIILPKEKEEIKEKIPFEIQSNEIIISYKESGKQKYLLKIIQRKDSFDNVPR